MGSGYGRAVGEQPWREDAGGHGRIVAVTDNPIARAIESLGAVVDRRVDVLDVADPLGWLAEQSLQAEDALVLCDHDAPFAEEILRFALTARLRYVAMMASRRRADAVRAGLADMSAEERAVLRMPAGLNIGGRSAGEIALSVLAEIVAAEYHRPGAAMSA
jgi:xanthine/CO dehydrogenase XdhC/CoxF family maturation factor